MDKLPCFTKNRSFSGHQNYCVGDKLSPSRILSDGEIQLTDPRSAKILDKVVEEVQTAVSWFLRSCKIHFSAKIFRENLHTSVKILQICMDLQDSVQRSLQNPAENILQICTDSQRSKTWEYTKKAINKDVKYFISEECTWFWVVYILL